MAPSAKAATVPLAHLSEQDDREPPVQQGLI